MLSLRHSVPRIGLVAALCSGCVEPNASTSATVRDSAGVRVVEYPAEIGTHVDRWHTSRDPTLRIGRGDDPNAEFFRVKAALRLANELIVVANYQTRELRFFDADGSFLRVAGGVGEGPGEFSGLDTLVRFGHDSLVAYDPILRRLSIFDLQGDFGRTTFLPPHEEASNPHQFSGMLSDGSAIIYSFLIDDPTSGTEEGFIRPLQLALRYLPDGATIDKIGVFTGPELNLLRSGGQSSVIRQPFGRMTSFAASGDELFIFDNTTYEFQVYSASSGKLRTVVRREHQDLRITSDEIAEDRERFAVAFGKDPKVRATRRRAIAKVEYPETMPAYGAVLLVRSGRVWIEDYRRPGDNAPNWTVFERDGMIVARASTPKGLKLTDVSEDYLIGIAKDSLDVETVELYSLIKP